ncbi:MAG: glycosyl transferase group 1 [Salinivirgaceae bacterium]|nr:MAG: glycosyl transferase group 1 [Salinivirgaceae bacterium]
MKRVILCVTNDLSTDQRVHKIATTLSKKLEYEVLLVGRKLKQSPLIKRDYTTKRLKLVFTKGPLFYFFFNFRLFLFLLFNKVDIIVSNDLDTLPGSAMAAKIKRKRLFYDSHELFTEVPELIHRKRVQRIWEKLERKYIKCVDEFYTVCKPIADLYTEKYGKKVKVVRNVSLKKDSLQIEKYEKPTLIYQGALNLGRGIDLMIDTMAFLPNYQLIIVGKGDLEKELKVKAQKLGANNIDFKGYVSFEELHELTSRAHIGLSWEENLGLNYYYALPNKVFDYIQARIPVLVSNLPGLKSIIEEHGVGEMLNNRTPEKIGAQIERLFEKRHTFDDALKNAARELIWEKEQEILIDIYTS